MSGWVTVTGPPSAICRSNSGETEPLEPSTLPNRTSEKRVPGAVGANAWMNSSAARLVAPITLVGFTALSVEMKVKALTPRLAAMVAQRRAPSTLVRIASLGLSSISGTCFSAAAWITRSGAASAIACSSRISSRTSPITMRRTTLG